MPTPKGHLILLAATQKDISGTTVTGDVIIDLDENHNPVWLWNEFDHLDAEITLWIALMGRNQRHPSLPG